MDRDDFGVAVDARDAGVNCEIAEQPAQRLVAFEIEVLVAEEDHRMFGERGLDLLQLAAAQRLGQIDAGNFRADMDGQGGHLDGAVGHGEFSEIRVNP